MSLWSRVEFKVGIILWVPSSQRELQEEDEGEEKGEEEEEEGEEEGQGKELKSGLLIK